MESEIKVINFIPNPNFTNSNIENLTKLREQQKQEENELGRH